MRSLPAQVTRPRLPSHWLRESETHIYPADWHSCDSFWRGRTIAPCAVRSDGVVLPPPAFDQDLGVRHGVEDLPVEQFITEFPVEGVHIAVLPRTPGFAEQRLHLQVLEPQPDELRREFRTIVRADVGGDPMYGEQVRERLEPVGCAAPSGRAQNCPDATSFKSKLSSA